jgi:Arc/MetJ-type ribon-helix-helix transcriptional regulator
MVRTQIQLTEEQSRALKKMASSRHLSISELVRQGVDVVLRSNVSIDASEKRKRALAIIGKYRSGKREISREHDKHLAEVYSK